MKLKQTLPIVALATLFALGSATAIASEQPKPCAADEDCQQESKAEDGRSPAIDGPVVVDESGDASDDTLKLEKNMGDDARLRGQLEATKIALRLLLDHLHSDVSARGALADDFIIATNAARSKVGFLRQPEAFEGFADEVANVLSALHRDAGEVSN